MAILFCLLPLLTRRFTIVSMRACCCRHVILYLYSILSPSFPFLGSLTRRSSLLSRLSPFLFSKTGTSNSNLVRVHLLLTLSVYWRYSKHLCCTSTAIDAAGSTNHFPFTKISAWRDLLLKRTPPLDERKILY